MLTIPRSVFKSSTKDLSFLIFEIMIQSKSQSYGAQSSKCYTYRYTRYIKKGEYRRFPAWILT